MSMSIFPPETEKNDPRGHFHPKRKTTPEVVFLPGVVFLQRSFFSRGHFSLVLSEIRFTIPQPKALLSVSHTNYGKKSPNC